MTRVAAPPRFAVVVPTIGRPCLQACLDALGAAAGPLPHEVVVVDDRRDARTPLDVRVPDRLRGRLVVRRGPAAGPAAARNVGWRAAGAEWIAFVDDDVVVGPDWYEEVAADLAAADPDVAGVQGVLSVPLPEDRRPTDWERSVAGLADARWATADMAYRRRVLEALDGFDERFPRAYREDADLALRVLGRGLRLTRGHRCSRHPVRPARWWVSLASQAGNVDDPLMARLHGRDWRRRVGAPVGRRRRHLGVTAAAGAALAAAASGHRRLAAACAAGWLAGTAEFALRRMRPGPADPAELVTMAVTSVLIPPLATAHWVRGVARARRIAR